jgi:hypothetical protein
MGRTDDDDDDDDDDEEEEEEGAVCSQRARSSFSTRPASLRCSSICRQVGK